MSLHLACSCWKATDILSKPICMLPLIILLMFNIRRSPLLFCWYNHRPITVSDSGIADDRLTVSYGTTTVTGDRPTVSDGTKHL